MDINKHRAIILIGFAESLSAPEVAWDLLNHGFQVIAFCRRGSYPPLRHIREIKLFGVTPPETDARGSAEDVRKTVELTGAAALLPLDDAAIWICDKAAIGLNVPVAGAQGETARFALDKRCQLEAARQAGFNVPATENMNEKHQLLKFAQVPAVIKPAEAVSEQNGRLIKGPINFCITRKDIEKVANECTYNGPMLVQPVLAGKGEGIFGLNSPGGVKKWSAHRRIRMINPLGSGSSACESLKITDHPIHAAERMLTKAKWPGMFMIELLRDTAGKLWFMEFNGRSWGSMALALRLGFHYPAWTVMQALDSSFLIPDTSPWKSIVCRHLGREIVHLLAVVKGKKAYALVPNYSRLKTLLAVLHLERNEEWYNYRPGNSVLFWEDTLKTILEKLAASYGNH